MLRTRKKAIGIVLLLLAMAGLALFFTGSDNPKPQSVKSPSKPKEVNPLFISEIKKYRAVPSQINIERELGDQGGYTAKVISFKSDGFIQYALQTVPPGNPPPGGWPVIIFCHGYIPPTGYQTAGQDYSSWFDAVTRSGYSVIKPDFRGHGQSQGTPEGGHFSPAYTYDVLNLMASLKQYPGIDYGRLAIAGHSMGAHVALRAAVVTPDIKKSIYISGVVGSMNDIFFNWPRPPYVNDQPTSTTRGRRQQVISQHGDPKSNPDFWNQASAINYVKETKGAAQIHHGTADASVPAQFSANLDQAFKKAGRPVNYYPYEGGDHQFTSSADRRLMLERIITFLNTN